MKLEKKVWKYAIVIPAIVSLVLTIMCYYYWNARFTFGFGDMSVRVSSAIKDLLVAEKTHDEVIAINVSYDRMLVPCNDELGIPLGEIDITDRHKLLSFMDSLAKWNNYRYIVCDVNFDNDIHTEWDDALFKRIAGMRDITVAGGADSEFSHPSVLIEKVSCSSYEQFLSGDGFLKFTYNAPDGTETMAYRMWRELEGGNIKRHWWGWSCGGKLCVRSFIPDLEFVTRYDYSSDGEKNLYNLGVDILAEPDMSVLFDNKIIMIGDFKEFDLHDTIKNEVAGTAIIYNTYLALCSGDHIVHWWILLLLFVVFGLEVAFALKDFWKDKDDKPKDDNEKRWKTILRNIVDVILTLIGYSGVLAIACFVIYLFSGLFVNAIIIGSFIAFLSLFVEHS